VRKNRGRFRKKCPKIGEGLEKVPKNRGRFRKKCSKRGEGLGKSAQK